MTLRDILINAAFTKGIESIEIPEKLTMEKASEIANELGFDLLAIALVEKIK